MKRLILAPLLLTLIVGCSNTDKTLRERRDDCADLYVGAITYREFSQKYNINKSIPFVVDDKARYSKELWKSQLVKDFCSYYKGG